MLHLWYYFKRKIDTTFEPVILVTGAGSGIGAALADALYNQKYYRVVVTARAKSLEKIRKKFIETDRFLIRELDITLENERISIVSEINKKWGGINILINNAGISYRSVIEQMTEADELKQLATNYLGPAGLIRLVLPHMREIGRGKIINISSVSGMLAMPTMSSYSASKHALEGMSEALWYETKPFGINVCLIQPGFIHSNSFKNVYHTPHSAPSKNRTGPYSDFYANMNPFIEKLMNLSKTTPQKIAILILKVVKTQNPPLWIPATLDALVFYIFRRIIPRRLLLPILFMALPKANTWGQKHSHKRD